MSPALAALLGLLLQAAPAQEPPKTPPPAAPAAVPAPAPAQAKPPVKPAEKSADGWQEFCCYEKGRAERDGLVTVVYQIAHVPSPPHHLLGIEEFGKMLQPYVTPGKGRIETSNRLSVMAVTDTKENIAFVHEMLKILHTPDAPIMIEAKVIELRWDNDLQIGLEGDLSAAAMIWGNNAGSDAALREVRARFNPSAALTGGPFQGSTFRFASSSAHQGTAGGLVQMFLERGRAHILSQPRVLVRADQTATIFSGEEVPYPQTILINPQGTQTTFGYKSAGVKLEVTPRLAAPGQISLKLKPEVTSTFGFVQIAPGTLAPQFTVRSVSTELLVLDKEEVVIGGLFRRDKTTIRRGLPFLSDIPVLGYLFGKYEDAEVIQEVLFMIRPTLLKSATELPRELIKPDK